MADTIKCPKCGTVIEIAGALRADLEAKVTKELESQKQLLAEQAVELQVKQDTIADQIDARLKVERQQIIATEHAKILAEQSEQTSVLKEELAEQQRKLKEANKKELDLLKKQQELEQAREDIELEVQRTIADERRKIFDDASKKATEEQELKTREKDDRLESLTKQITELKRRAEVGSQQAAGEALEENLEDLLRQTFSFDQFDEVKKGQRGADILHKVYNTTGKFCGTLLWEAKSTSRFNDAWISKLRKDQQDAKADIAIIATVALPKEIENFGRQGDIWVSDFKSAVGLATALRQLLIEVARQKLVSVGQASTKDLIYEYVTGTEFAMHIKEVVSAFAIMQEDLEKEKRAIALIWKKREKQLSTVLGNIAGMKGSIEGLAQQALPEADTMSLEAVAKE